MNYLVSAGCALLVSSFALCAQAQVGQVDAANLPIADVHFHYMVFMTPDELRARMDRHNIRWVVSAGAQGAGGAAGIPGAKNPWQRDTELKFELKDRFVAAVGGPETFNGERRDGSAFFTDSANLWAVAAVERMRDLLKQDRRTFVELFPNAENSSMEPMRRRRLPTNAPFFKEVMRLAASYNVPVPMHMEWHPESVAQLSELLTEFPQANVVLSHCGKITVAEDLRPFFQKHSNVYCDLGYRSSPQGEGESRRDPRRLIYWSTNLQRKADIKPDWLQLVEDFPDRFMLAIDDVVSWDQYDQVVAATREGVLAKLRPATAEKVAYRNAVKLFGLAETTSSYTPTAKQP
jgi:hypothetical protein